MTVQNKLFNFLKKDHGVEIRENMINLNEMLEKVNDIGNPESYIRYHLKKTMYTKKNGVCYIDYDRAMLLLKRAKKGEGLALYNRVKQYDTETISDFDSKIYKYKGADVDIIYDEKNNKAWVKGNLGAEYCGHIHKDHAIKIHVPDGHKISYREIRHLSPNLGYNGHTLFIDKFGINNIVVHSVKDNVDKDFIVWINDVVDKLEGATKDIVTEFTNKNIEHISIRIGNKNIIAIKGLESYWFWAMGIGKIINEKQWSNIVKDIDADCKYQFPDLLDKLGIDIKQFDTSHLTYSYKAISNCNNTKTIWVNLKGAMAFIKQFQKENNIAEEFLDILTDKVKPMLKPANIEITQDKKNKCEFYKQDGLNMIKLVFEGIELTGIRGLKDELWFVCNESCNMLDIKNKHRTINELVDSKYVTTYEKLIIDIGGTESVPLTYNQKNTKMINESGLYQLATKSRKPVAIIFQKWLFEDVLPSIRKTGKYDIKDHIETCFLDDNHIDDYRNCNVNYIGYIGNYDGERYYKYGYTDDFNRREGEHIKDYGTFIVKYIGKCLDNKGIEKQFERHLDRHNIRFNKNINGKHHKEIFSTTEDHTIDTIVDKMDKIITKHNRKYLKEEKNHIGNHITIDKNIMYEIEKEKTKQKILDMLINKNISESNAMILLQKY